jgi:hypothetical protein
MTSRTLISFVVSLLTCTVAASLTFPEPLPSSARPTDPLPIRTLLDGATSYQGHNVAVIGRVTDVEKLPPMPAGKGCRIRYDTYVLNVEDESGSIRVEAMGTCQVEGVVNPVQEGDRVLVEGIFIQLQSGNLRSPTHYIFTTGLAIRRLPQ